VELESIYGIYKENWFYRIAFFEGFSRRSWRDGFRVSANACTSARWAWPLPAVKQIDIGELDVV
jgi:hypothetical protein